MRILIALLCALAVAGLLAGCGGGNEWDLEVLPWIHDIEGTYQAREPVADWGRIVLRLERVNRSRAYDGALYNPAEEGFGVREGIGTLANDHFIVNLDEGAPKDFYFEGGVVVDENENVLGLSGRFIIPDEEGYLPVEFDLLSQPAAAQR